MLPFFVSNPVKVSVGVVVVALFGTIAVFQLPMQLTPEVRNPTTTIRLYWPGASPFEIESELVQEFEERLKDVKGMRRMTSRCSYSSGFITLEFSLDTNMSEAQLEINSRMNQIRNYPEDAYDPLIYSADLSDRPICWFVLSPNIPTQKELKEFVDRHPHLQDVCQPLLDAHKWDLLLRRLLESIDAHPELATLLPVSDVSELREFVENTVEAQFDRVAGVADCWTDGGKREEVQVIIDPAKLASRQLTIEHLRRAIRGRNNNSSGGEVWSGKRRLIVRTIGRFQTPEQIANVIVTKRDGVPIYVSDVAEVRYGFKRASETYRRGGTELIGLGCRAETGANILETVDGLRAVTKELNEGVLKQRGLLLSEVWSDADYIRSSVGLVNQNIVYGGVLTIIVLLCFLRSARSTLVIGVAVPTSIVGTFLILRVLGRSLNVISLAGMAFAVGMIVDNAVVVLENIFRRYEQGEPPVQAAVQGTREVWGAILASTLTTLAVFVPVFFIQEEAGQLFRDIALAISAAVGLSLVVAISVIPTAAARLLPEHDADTPRPGAPSSCRTTPWMRWMATTQSWLDRISQQFVAMVVAVNARMQQGVVSRIAFVIVCIAMAIGLSYYLFPSTEYLPRGSKNRIRTELHPPPGYNLPQVQQIAVGVFETLRPYWEAAPGSIEAQQLEFPLMTDLLVRAKPGEIMVQVQAHDASRVRELLPLMRETGRKIPGMNVRSFQLSLLPGSSRHVDVVLSGPDIEQLLDAARAVRDRVREAIPDAQVYTVPGLSSDNPEIHVYPDWERAADMGVPPSELSYAVDALIDGAYVADFSRGGEKIDLRILGDADFDIRQEQIGELPMTTSDGELVPLSSLVNIELGTGPRTIHRVERRRAVTVGLRPPDGMTLGSAIELLERQIIAPLNASRELDPTIHVGLGDSADRLRETWNALRFNLLLAVAITYLLMAALFESWVYPFVIILSVPLAAVGGVLGIWIVNLFVEQPMDVITMLGFVILIGTSVNNAILIVHYSLTRMREHGEHYQTAILESVRSRIRPILMTTGTTVVGLFPLVVMPGSGSELYRGLGSVVLGGLVVSTALTLFLVPTVFGLMMEIVERRR